VSVGKFADWIVPETAEKVARFDLPYLSDYAAITKNRFGKGIVYYVGTCFAGDEALAKLMKYVLADANLSLRWAGN
jgi:beta-galactosidase